MLTILFIITIFFTVGTPVRFKGKKLQHAKEFQDALLSNLQLLIPIKGNQRTENKEVFFYQVRPPGRLGIVPDGPYSQIPDSEFVLDDTSMYFDAPKKTIKKDLSQVEYKSRENSFKYPVMRLTNNEALNPSLFEKCRKLLQIEHLRSEWEPRLQIPLNDKESQNEDHDLILKLCKALIERENKQSNENLETSGDVFATASSGNVGYSGTGGAAGNLGAGGNSAYAGNVGVGGKGGIDSSSNTWADDIALNILKGLGLGLGNLGINGHGGIAGNAGFNGHGGAAGNVGIGGKGGQAGNLGIGGKGGLVGNLGIGGQGGFFGNVGIGSTANQYIDLYSDSGQGNFLSNFLPGLPNQATKNEGEGNIKKASLNYPPTNQDSQKENNRPPQIGDSGVHVALTSHEPPSYQVVGGAGAAAQGAAINVAVDGRGDQYHSVGVAGKGNLVKSLLNVEPVRDKEAKQIARNEFYVGSLAYGGHGGQIGNLAVNGGRGNSRAHICCDSHCIHVYYLLINSPAARLGLASPGPGAAEPTSPRPDREHQAEFESQFRPMSGRRDWMVLDNKYDERLRQYVNNHKPWLVL